MARAPLLMDAVGSGGAQVWEGGGGTPPRAQGRPCPEATGGSRRAQDSWLFKSCFHREHEVYGLSGETTM